MTRLPEEEDDDKVRDPTDPSGHLEVAVGRSVVSVRPDPFGER